MLVALILLGCSHNLDNCTAVPSQNLFFETVSACEISITETPNLSVNAPVSLSYCVQLDHPQDDPLAKLSLKLTSTDAALENT